MFLIGKNFHNFVVNSIINIQITNYCYAITYNWYFIISYGIISEKPYEARANIIPIL